jgi:geranylgeranyl pyrophosphate synthase
MKGSNLMNFAFTRVLAKELREVEDRHRENLASWWDELASLRESLREDKSLQLIPAVVVLAYRYLNSDHKLTINMAGLFKTLYFANLIHIRVKDEEEGQTNDQRLQFAILIGDYIFGRILKLLLEINAVEVLDNLALMICGVNEGLVMRHRLDAEPSEVIKRGNAAIYGTAFTTAARLKGLDQKGIELYGQIGCNLGMALELLIEQKDDLVLPYVETSIMLLDEFSKKYGFGDNCLNNLLQDILHAVRPVHMPVAGSQ